MENFSVIEFHRTRDFSKKLNATFEFLRQNFKSLGKSVLYIAGPCVLIASLLIGSFMAEITALGNPGLGARGMENYFISPGFWLQWVLMMVLMLLGSVMMIATVYNYIILYNEKRTNQISVQEVWDRVRETIWMYLGSMILYWIV